MSDDYMRSRNCSCMRCRTRGLMGAAILITIGVLFLLQEYWYIRFDRTWPVILLVIGVMSLISRTASSEGHMQPYWQGGPATPPPASSQDPWAGGRVPQTPPTSGSGEQQPGDRQEKP